MATLGERIKIARKKLGMNQSELAKKIGVGSATVVSRYESNEREPELAILVKLSKTLNCDPAWLLMGIREDEETEEDAIRRLGVVHNWPKEEINAFLKERARKKEKPLTVSEESVIYNKEEFVFVPQVSGEISAGGGLVPDNIIEIRIAFRKDWIRRKGDPHNMSLIRVSGDSMEPTLQSGDLVLVDHARNFIDPQGGIYAIAIDNIIMIKRIQVLYPSQKIRVISDNNKYDPLEAEPAQVRINGKVIWFGREIER